MSVPTGCCENRSRIALTMDAALATALAADTRGRSG
jgi:hypothetical protein